MMQKRYDLVEIHLKLKAESIKKCNFLLQTQLNSLETGYNRLKLGELPIENIIPDGPKSPLIVKLTRK